MTTLLARPEDLAAVRGVPFDPTDIAAEVALEAASDAIRAYTSRQFDLVEDDVITLRGSGTSALVLPEAPIIEVSEVIETCWVTDEITLDPADYYFDAKPGLLFRWGDPIWIQARWFTNARYEITYTHGWVLPGNEGANLPADIQEVAIALAVNRMVTTASGGQVVESETIGRYSVTYATRTSTEVGYDLSESQRRCLDAYRLRTGV